MAVWWDFEWLSRFFKAGIQADDFAMVRINKQRRIQIL